MMSKNEDLKLIAEQLAHLNKEDDIVEKLHQIDIDSAVLKAEQAVNAKWKKMVHAVCVTTTSAIMGFFVWLGGVIYDKYDAVEAGIRAFIMASRGIK